MTIELLAIDFLFLAKTHLAFPVICVRIASVEFDMFSHPGFVFAMYMPSGAP